MDFGNSVCVIGGFVPKLEDYVEKGNFIQEGARYRK